MIVYFDTSAFVPLLIAEAGSAAARRLWEQADSVVAVRLLYVEAAAALRRAEAMRRVGRPTRERALEQLDRYWAEFVIVELDDSLMRRAAQLADAFSLRGYDAVHCAAAELLADPEMVAASGDADVLAGWRALGRATAKV